MIEFLTSRSRALDALRCPRARWELHERQGTGFEPVRQAVPLVTGASVHAGCAALLSARLDGAEQFSETELDLAASIAVATYERGCEGRGLELDQLEDQSYVFNEQKALVEALVRLAGMRVIPRILEMYEVLEVERMDKRTLHTEQDSNPVCHCGTDLRHHSNYDNHSFTEMESPYDFRITWRSIPDALIRSRTDGGLYLLSWKTAGQLPRESEARVDMQGVSEAWAIQERLDQDYDGARIRGVQMVYLVKGERRAMAKDTMLAQGLTQDQLAAGGKMYKTASPLIYGYQQEQSFPPKLAWGTEWRCASPHAMRKSKWYPTGECPGDGRNHRRGDDWSSFPVWGTLGVKEWMRMLDDGEVTPEAGDALGEQWAMPVPNFRTLDQMENWLAQTRANEVRIARDLLKLRELERNAPEQLASGLNESVLGPQATSNCDHWYGRKCPAWDLCHGPVHVQEDPVASGLYQVKTQYEQKEVE